MQTSLFDLELQATVNVKATVRKVRTPRPEDIDWGDIYSEYEDFNLTSQSWK